MKLFHRIIVFPLIFLNIIPLNGQNRLQSYIDNILKNDYVCQNSIVGICVTDINGNIIAGWNEKMRLECASNMKIVTSAVALSVLGPDYRFKTSIAYSGTVKDGILNGDLYIIGGADPLLGSNNEIAIPLDTIYSQWLSSIKEAGIKSIDGRIIGDERFFANIPVHDNWDIIDAGSDYGSGSKGLNFAENIFTVQISHGTQIGDKIIVKPSENVPSRFKFITTATTGAKGIGNQTDFYPDFLTQAGKIAGSYGVDAKSRKIACANHYSALSCAESFKKYLETNGIECGIAESSSTLEQSSTILPKQSALKVIAETFSPSLSTIIKKMLVDSNNLYAETIFRTTGLALCGKSDYKSVVRAFESYIKDNFCSTNGFIQDDGSGLSRNNVVSPEFFCRFLTSIECKPFFQTYLNSFPIAGVSGTVQQIIPAKNENWKNHIFVKSGSMELVRCYSGYIETSEGYLKFSIMFNNFSVSSNYLITLIESLLREIDYYASSLSQAKQAA